MDNNNERKIIPVTVNDELHNRFKSACKDNYDTMSKVLRSAALNYTLTHEERVNQQPCKLPHNDN